MARPLRIDLAGGWYHVTSRGNERRAIYRDDQDRRHFLELLAELPDRFRVRVHGYVLMDNHYHLQLETPEANLSRAVQWLNVSYSVWFNRRHRRSGHLFQGRFKAVVTDTENWVVEVSRYLHLNPVRVGAHGLDKAGQQKGRAGLIDKPRPDEVRRRIATLRQYRWSSYRAYIGLEKEPAGLTCSNVRPRLGGRTAKEQREVYRQFVEDVLREGLPERPWERLEAGMILGSRAFVDKLSKLLRADLREQPAAKALRPTANFESIKKAVERLKGQKWEHFRDRHGDWGRDLGLYLARKHGGMKLKELGEAVGGMDYASVSATVKRFERRAQRERSLAEAVAQARELLNAKM